MDLIVDKVTSNRLALTNCAFLNPATLAQFCEIAGMKLEGQTVQAFGVPAHVGNCVLNLRASETVAPGVIALNMVQRISANLEMDKPTTVSPLSFDPYSAQIAHCTFEVDVLKRGAIAGTVEIDCDELTTNIKTHLLMQVFTGGQSFFVKSQGYTFRLRVIDVFNVHLAAEAGAGSGEGVEEAKDEAHPSVFGQLAKNSNIMYKKHKDAPLRLKGAAGNRSNRLFERGFNFQELGIGGLDKEFGDIFRRAFASRVFPADVVRKMGIPHVRGMLLFGPPGCGKTLIARQLGKALNAREPKIVNGPSILDKYVGGSEEKIRELFVDAEKEQAEKGDASELHIIIFDEIDAICKARGSTHDGTGVHDSIVNQLLSKIDGVEALNNVLIIGMTNRRDLIDQALLRPGRLEVHVEIGLPDDVGRVQILSIHTSSMRKHGFLAPDVDIDNLAARTKNYTGAEIEGLVKSAAAFSFERQVDARTLRVTDPSKLRVEQVDFDRALQEVKPAFGKEDDELKIHYRNGIVHFGPRFEEQLRTVRKLVQQVRTSERTPLLSVLLQGESGCGKTALAAYLGVESAFPFVKMVSADSMLGMSEAARCARISAVFNDAYKSPLSLIILDDIERLLDYVPLGPRFSNPVLQTLLVLIKKEPPTAGRRLMVVGTTCIAGMLRDMGITTTFNVTLDVPVLENADEIRAVLREDGDVAADVIERICSAITKPIAIKQLMMVVEMARQEEGTVQFDSFMSCLHSCGWGFDM